MTDERPKTIEQLREELARQILETAIDSDNPQFKVDAFKALEKWGISRGNKTTPTTPGPGSAMSSFQARVKRAEEGNGDDAEQTETD